MAIVSQIITAARIKYLDPETDTEGELLVSSHPHTDPGLGPFEPRIPAGSDPEISIEVSMPQWRRHAQTSYSTIDLINVDGVYDFLTRLEFADRAASVAFLRSGQAWSEQLFGWRAVVDDVRFRGTAAVQIVLRSLAQKLRRPIHTGTFPESVPVEELQNKPVPLVIGRPVQCPCLLYEEVGSAEVRWYVAENVNRMWEVHEGGLEITEGSSPGQYQQAAGGFTLNKKATLPVTADPIGPYRSHFPIPQLRFLVWDQLAGADVPAGWTYTGNDPAGSYWIRRHGTTSSAEISAFGSNQPTMDRSGLQAGRQYRLRLRFGSLPGGSAAINLRVYTRNTSGGETLHLGNQLIVIGSLPDGVWEMTLTVPTGHTILRLNWNSPLVAALVRVLKMEVIEEHQNAVAQHIDDVVPLLVSDMAEQPLGEDELDYESLAALRDVASGLRIARYCTGTETVESILDECLQAMPGLWWFDDLLRVGRLEPPEASGPVILEITDQNRLSDIQLSVDSPERLVQSVAWDRNWQPVAADRAAASLSSEVQARNALEYRRTARALQSAINSLHPYYRARLTSEPRETLLARFSPVQAEHLAPQLALYQSMRFWWRVSLALPGVEDPVWPLIKPLALVTLQSLRFGAVDKRLRIIGVKLRPSARRCDLLLWG